MEPGMAGAYAQGWAVYRKEPRMAVRVCPGMGGIGVRSHGWRAHMSMDGRYIARSHGWRCVYVLLKEVVSRLSFVVRRKTKEQGPLALFEVMGNTGITLMMKYR